MTKEEKKARKLSAESGNIRWIKDHCLRTKDGEDDYVFISYKSDDFEKVLDDIVYHTCKKYGLKVYFDTAFDENSDSWITQYYDNMCDPKCKAFIAFIDDAYYSSYACLLEMMSRKTAAAGGDYELDTLFFLPINIGPITAKKVSNVNTGLGTKRFSNGIINIHAKEELEQFNEIFSQVATDNMRKHIYKRERDTQLYEEKIPGSPEHGKMYLNVTQCRKLMEEIIPKKNNNDGENKSFIDVIHDKLVSEGIDSVFGQIFETETGSDDLANDKQQVKLPVNKEKERSKSGGVEIHVKEKANGYAYRLWGNLYKANKLVDMMHDVFDLVAEKYPAKIADIADDITISAVALKDEVDHGKLPQSKLNYFLAKKEHVVNGTPYYVSTRYNREQGIEQLKRILSFCEGTSDAFEIVSEPGKSVHNINRKKDETIPLTEDQTPDSSPVSKGESGSDETVDHHDAKEKKNTNGYTYRLWGNLYTANKLADMMHDVFDLVAEKYPEKIADIADGDTISAVALKDDVDHEKLPQSRLNYFMAKKEHVIKGTSYYVSTHYNRMQGIDQLKRILSFCEGTSDAFEIVSEPHKPIPKNNGKKGIGELL